MELIDFIKVLMSIKVETSKTFEFDNFEENGERKYGQREKRDDRWWDKIKHDDKHSSQVYHVIGHFACWYYQGAPSNCPKKCYECFECYKEKELKQVLNDIDSFSDNSGRSAQHIYNGMNRPEMYICIAEMFGIDELEKIIDDIKEAMDKYETQKEKCNAGCNKAKELIPWAKVEEKAEKIQKQLI